jgi:glycosyltransferase involved in cell wall biosynthesis
MAGQSSLIAVSANEAWNLVNFRAGLIKSLRDDGYRILAITPRDQAMEEQLAKLGCSFAPVTFDAMGISPLHDLKSFWELYRVLLHHRPGAWLSWTIKPNIYGTLAARLLGIAALPNVSGLGTAFIRRTLLTRLVKRLYRVSFSGAQTVFFQNQDDRDLFVGEGIVARSQARLVPGSGVDLERFTPPSPSRPARRQFLMISRLVADKGAREYASAARVLRNRWPDARFRLMGPVEVANRTAISVHELRQWQEEGVIEYLPATMDVRPAIASADFVVLPSYREGLSRVLLEAAAMGRPIVTTDTPGCRDVVTDGLNGFLCAPRDAAALSDALQRAAETDDEDWHRMARESRRRAEAEFSQETVIACYKEALRKAGAPW